MISSKVHNINVYKNVKTIQLGIRAASIIFAQVNILVK